MLLSIRTQIITVLDTVTKVNDTFKHFGAVNQMCVSRVCEWHLRNVCVWTSCVCVCEIPPVAERPTWSSAYRQFRAFPRKAGWSGGLVDGTIYMKAHLPKRLRNHNNPLVVHFKLTWAFWAAVQKSSEPEDDGSLVLLNDLEAHEEGEGQCHDDDHPRDGSQQPAAYADPDVDFVGWKKTDLKVHRRRS